MMGINKTSIKYFILLTLTIFLIVSCSAEQQITDEIDVVVDNAIAEDETENEITTEALIIPEENIPEEPEEEITIQAETTFQRITQETYLGIWMPSIPGEQSLEDADDLLEIGANTVEFGVIIPYDAQGQVLTQGIEYDELKSTIKYYKIAGLSVALVLEPFPVEAQGEPGPVPTNILDNFLESYSSVVIEIAEIAEELQVEVFSPMNEQDYKIGISKASSFGQDILPQIQSVFTGELLWKGSLFEHVESGNVDIDFTGYDIVGFSSFPFSGINRYPSEVQDYVSTIGAWANEDGVNRLWIAEFGTYDPVPISTSEEPDAVRIVFEEANVEGYFVFDPPRGFGTAIKGSELEEVVSNGFSSLKE